MKYEENWKSGVPEAKGYERQRGNEQRHALPGGWGEEERQWTTEFAAGRSLATLTRLILWSSEDKSLFGWSQEEMKEMETVITDTF